MTIQVNTAENIVTVEMEKQCGCFKKSGFVPVQSFASKDEAMKEAEAMND